MEQLRILAVLTVSIAVAHWLGRHRAGRWIGGALLVILIVAVLANLGVVPLAGEGVPVYVQLLGTAAPVSIFLLLLVDARLGSLKRAGAPMLALFGFAALGTVLGVLVDGRLLDASSWTGEWYAPMSGMFAAIYIGGGANFNALALQFEFIQTGHLYAAAVVADHVLTVVWIALLLVFPRLLAPLLARFADAPGATVDDVHEPARPPALGDLAILLALGLSAFVLSETITAWLAAATGVAVPSTPQLTTLALLLAQLPWVARLRGAGMLGMYGAYLFLAALAAYCEVSALAETGRTGLLLLVFRHGADRGARAGRRGGRTATRSVGGNGRG